jgi:hypothetical protein
MHAVRPDVLRVDLHFCGLFDDDLAAEAPFGDTKAEIVIFWL